MEISPRAQAIVLALYERNKPLAEGDDEARRSLTLKMAEQCAFELGDEWGAKRTAAGHPLSKDVVAFNGLGGFVGWDWQHGETRRPLVPPIFHRLEGQIFVPVTPRNHLGVEEPAPMPEPEPRPVPSDDVAAFLVTLLEPLERIADAFDSVATGVQALNDRLLALEKNGVRLRVR